MASYFYDGQIRRYLVQVIRLFSNFVVKRSDGTLEQVPVMYGDIDRQVAHIINQNSENTVVSAPRIAVYMSELSLDRERLSDSSYIGKIHLRERDISSDGSYGYNQGSGFTVERLMPTPFKLQLKVDLWTASTDQKLQLIEQISGLFNPSLEIQTTDNYVDWTSLSVVDLIDISLDSRTVPAGADDQISIATLTLETPIWISPPAKVKKLGIITNIISNIYGNITDPTGDYIEGLGVDLNSGSRGMTSLLFTTSTAAGDYDINVDGKDVHIIRHSSTLMLSWHSIIEQLTDKYTPGLLKVCLKQPNGSEVVGFAAVNPFNDEMLTISEWDTDTFPKNTLVPGSRADTASGTFDAIVDPKTFNPDVSSLKTVGTRFMIVDNIGGGQRDTFISEVATSMIFTDIKFSDAVDAKVFVNNVEVGFTLVNKNDRCVLVAEHVIPIGATVSYEVFVNHDGPAAWKNVDQSDFIADANDIIEWDGNNWRVVFSAKENRDNIVYQTNIFTMIQYKWNGVSWTKSFDGVYRRGLWRIVG